MMRKLVFFPSDPIRDYLKKGRTYNYLDEYYNPGHYFDEVFCLSPWGEKEDEVIGEIHYIKANPLKFKSIIKGINPDAIRGYGGYCCADWVSISKVSDIPTIVSVHDTNPELIHESLKYADYVFCMSQAVRNAIINKLGIPDSKLFVLPNRVDTDLFSKKEDRLFFEQLNNRFGNGKHVLHIGRKAEQKNLETVITSLPYLRKDVSCVFVGQGDTSKYQELAEQLGVFNRCYFVDRVETNELPYWYSWCDCFCVPSRWEGFGMVFIEAASCEAPIVTSNISPMNEFLQNDVNAILVDDFENPSAMANAIEKVLENAETIQMMRKNARKVGLLFEKKIVDQKEADLYSMAIQGKGKSDLNKELRREMQLSYMKKGVKSKLLSIIR